MFQRALPAAAAVAQQAALHSQVAQVATAHQVVQAAHPVIRCWVVCCRTFL